MSTVKKGAKTGGAVAKPRNGPKPPAAIIIKEKVKSGTIPDFPILHYGVNNNFAEFSRQLKSYAFKEYGYLGKCIQDLEYYVPAEVEYDPEDLNPDVDNFGFNRRVVEKKIDQRERLIADMNDAKPKLHAAIKGNLSVESLQVLRESEHWDDLELNDNPLLLWLCIIETHQTNATGNRIVDIERETTNYQRMFQGNYESLGQFKQRFDDQVQVLADLGVERTQQE
jgi:uncharacterized protein Smg (DUF494 family)